MKFAIIAAGEGSRLAQEGVEQPKPLVSVKGEPLIDRLTRIFADNGAEEIIVICNERMTQVRDKLVLMQKSGIGNRHVPLRLTVKSTPSSMHSMFEIGKMLEGAPFCLTTVDTIFREDEFKAYINALGNVLNDGSEDGLMGVTDFIDDEKPLYISTDSSLNITGFHDTPTQDCQYISGGIYGLTDKSLQTLNRCIQRGESRMRNFQRALVAEGMRLKAYPFSKILDIDHKGDIKKAEDFLGDNIQ